MSKNIKNVISLISFIILMLIFAGKFQNKISRIINVRNNINETDAIEVVEEDDNITEKTERTESTERTENIESNESLEVDENDIFGLSKLSQETQKENFDLIYQCKLFEIYFQNNNYESYYTENKNDWIGFLDGKIFCGDSNANRVQALEILPKEYVFGMPAKSVKEQYDIIDKFDFSKCNTIILWNGFIIKNFKTVKDYIKSYDDLVKKIKSKKEDIKVYACSLMPVSKIKLEEDINEGSPHDFYKAEEYDKALKEYFGDKYIDIKFLSNEGFYSLDGYHLNKQFYKLLIPYVALYLRCKEVFDK